MPAAGTEGQYTRIKRYARQSTLCRLAMASVAVVVPAKLLGPVTRSFAPGSAPRMAMAGVGVALVLACYAAYVRSVEQRPVRELALPAIGRELTLGCVLGLGAFTLAMAMLAALGACRITGPSAWSVMLATIPGFLVVAVFEEVLFRLVLLRMLEELLGSWAALAISALVFGFMHLGNPHATVLGALAIAIEAGVLLGAAYLLTRRLWLCLALHFSWNVAQGGIFSVPVSGHAHHGLFDTRLAGPDWLTGGQFGVEASLGAIVVCSALAAALLLRVVRTGQIVPMPMRRPATAA